MAETVFKSLCRQAWDAGARRLRFEVDLDAFMAPPAIKMEFEGSGPEGCWVATTDTDESPAKGRSGEEALKRLVNRLTGVSR